MSLIDTLMYSIGSVFLIFALIFTYYSVQLAKLMKGSRGRHLMSVGAVLFIVAGMIYSLDAFFPRRGLHLSAFIVWMVALFTLIYGEFLVGRAIQKVYRSSLLRIAWENPGSIHYLIGISVLVFCAAPVYLLEILRPTTEEFSWYSVLSVAIWAFCFANLALAKAQNT